MPTPVGLLVASASVLTIGLGRFFGIAELFVIGAGMASAVVWAVLTVNLRRAGLAVERIVRPARSTAGEPARADLELTNVARTASAPVEVVEAVGPSSSARMRIGPLASGDRILAGYRIPTDTRGRFPIGPTVLRRQDPLGLARTTATVCPIEEVIVRPACLTLPMPTIGRGRLGGELAAGARRIGPGEFHGLRAYVEGDEPRSVDWKASARADGLIVREHRSPELRRCTVVLDRSMEAFGDHDRASPGDAFELAVVVAASIVGSAAEAGLNTRFRTGGFDLRGPHTAELTLDLLADLEPGPPLDHSGREHSDDLGLLVVVTASDHAPIHASPAIVDPSSGRLTVLTAPATSGEAATAVRTTGGAVIRASSIETFLDGWHRLVGSVRRSARGAEVPR